LKIFYSIVLTGCLFVFSCVVNIDSWLVVDNQPAQADLIVVLGGGGVSRLRKGLDLYEQGYANHIVLVDDKLSAWVHIVTSLCKECHLDGKNVVVITGSTSTFTDARLVYKYAVAHAIHSILVVTDPYHTRRVSLVFHGVFNGYKADIRVISSGVYGELLSPDQDWWHHKRTYETVLLELLKSLYVIARSLGQ